VLWLLVRLAVTATALGWTLAQLAPGELAHALGRVAPWALAGALGFALVGMTLGALRWRFMLLGYGAKSIWPFSKLLRATLVGYFYNTFLPANIGGDVLRGYVTRHAFDGGVGSYLVIFVERVFGLAGLVLLAGGILAIRPIGDFVWLPWIALAAVGSALLLALLPMFARRLIPWMPTRLRTPLRMLPDVERPSALLVVLGTSVLTHGVAALIGHTVLVSIDPTQQLLHSLSLIPVALVAVYFPTVGGLGTREAAFVVLLSTVGVSRADATAASLAFFAVQLLTAAMGGLLHLLAPLRDERAD
jgi:hypothetical protein